MLFLNWLLILTPAAAVLGLMSLRKRHTDWAIPIIVPCSLFAGYGFAGWPVIAALHSVQNYTVTTLAAVVTIALVLGVSPIYFQLLPKMERLVAVTPT